MFSRATSRIPSNIAPVIEHLDVTQLLMAMRVLRRDLENGALRGAAIDRALQRLPQLGADAKDFLWSPLGAGERRAIHEEQHKLALLAPNAKLYVHRTLAEADGQSRLNELIHARDYSAARTFAASLARKFPQSDLASWYRRVANGEL